jgi:hypothetical protein
MTTEHAKVLKQAREMMVKSRRELAEGLAKHYDGRTTPGLRSGFNEVQHTIEQIDKAIAEEQKFAPGPPPKGFGPKGDRYSEDPPDDNQGYR